MKDTKLSSSELIAARQLLEEAITNQFAKKVSGGIGYSQNSVNMLQNNLNRVRAINSTHYPRRTK